MPRRAEMLVSLRASNGMTLHAYAIYPSTDKLNRDMPGLLSSKICEIADQAGLSYLPVILSTTLSSGGVIVRDIMHNHEDLKEALELAQKCLSGQDKHHFSVWVCPTGCPDDIKLMELH